MLRGPGSVPRAGEFVFDVRNFEPASYGACDALAAHEWLSYDELEVLASQLEDRYQCDVTIDAERARTPPHVCTEQRRRRHKHMRT